MQQQSLPSFKNHLSISFTKDIDTFRQRNFTQWVFTGSMGYSQSLAGWDFFGFLVRGPQILCIAATDNGDFFFSHVQHHFLEQVLPERLKAHRLPASESVRMTLLDLAAADPGFFLTLPYQRIPADLMLWDEDTICIFVAQLTLPSQHKDLENEMTEALFRWMDKDILIFLRRWVQCPTLGEYGFLKSADNSESLAQRMREIIHHPVVLHRKPLPDFFLCK
ncbi:hypothetical protein [Acidithiobacillus albertensis]|uniref:hypothetical protein n=1 Tax=Acidithiobacillus albertensis TaxID=119978 RepID=UPI001C06C3BA|nr:hypothetical protein [Acidithiobacillus albertensis]MBU2741550.1 hypothetical protein [Acidithiobacillus albertensis]